MKTIGYLIGAIFAAIFVFFGATLLFGVFAAFLLAFVAAWACGAKITISQNGEKIGYVQWFKFHRK